MILYFIGVYIINRTLHGRLEIRNFSSRVSTLKEKFLISARSCNILYIFCFLVLNVETEVNPEDVLKLESQESGSIFDNNNDEISEDEEDENDEETELINTRDEQEQCDDDDSEGVGKKDSNTESGSKETDNNIEPKIKTMKKPKRAEYKVIR